MIYFDWNNGKNALLKEERSISFEEVILAIEKNRILAVLRHPNQKQYSSQQICIVEIDNYAYIVQFVETKETIFLKTIIPSRKMKKFILQVIKMVQVKLDEEEQAVLSSVEAGEWQPVEDQETCKKSYKEVARATFRKDSRVNIRLPKRDVTAIQVKAMEEGIPYQTMMASILHKYVTGKLVEKQS